jgi:hypothetical protein
VHWVRLDSRFHLNRVRWHEIWRNRLIEPARGSDHRLHLLAQTLTEPPARQELKRWAPQVIHLQISKDKD